MYHPLMSFTRNSKGKYHSEQNIYVVNPTPPFSHSSATWSKDNTNVCSEDFVKFLKATPVLCNPLEQLLSRLFEQKLVKVKQKSHSEI